MKKLAFIIFVSALAACRPSGALSPEERERLDLEVGAAATDIYGEVCRWYNAHGDSYGEGQDFDRRFLTPGLYSIRLEAGDVREGSDERVCTPSLKPSRLLPPSVVLFSFISSHRNRQVT